MPRNTAVTLTFAYCACLVIAPATAGSSYLMPLILSARILLFAPLFIVEVTRPIGSRQGVKSESSTNWREVVRSCAVPAVMCILIQAFNNLQDQHSVKEIGGALFSDPAITSLGCDFVISIISFAVWQRTQRGTLVAPGKDQKLS